jgi:putative flippase GtrA
MAQEPAASLATGKDYRLGLTAGTFIGLLALPILATAKPDFFSALWLPVLAFFMIASPGGIFVASIIGRRIPIVWQIAKFVLIGGLNTLVDVGVLAAIIAFFRNLSGAEPDLIVLDTALLSVTAYSFYKAFSFLVANINSFVWNKYWTFSDTRKSTPVNHSTQFAQFFLVSLIGFFLNNLFASYIFVSVSPMAGLNISQWALIGAAFGSIAGLAWNFLGYKLFVFKR